MLHFSSENWQWKKSVKFCFLYWQTHWFWNRAILLFMSYANFWTQWNFFDFEIGQFRNPKNFNAAVYKRKREQPSNHSWIFFSVVSFRVVRLHFFFCCFFLIFRAVRFFLWSTPVRISGAQHVNFNLLSNSDSHKVWAMVSFSSVPYLFTVFNL